MFNKVSALTGGRIRYFVCGSAALDRDVARWFDAAGMPILEGYGLTETSAATCLVRPDDQSFGTVGQPIPGTEIRIAADGEILLRGPHLMTGYRNLPHENAEVMLADGWLATGDIGSLDQAGRLRITDRKKDLVKTSGGKYIAPGAIAARFKALTALGSHLIVHANNRNYVTALVSLDPEALTAFAAAHGMTGDHVTLSQTVAVRAAIQATIDELNATLNRWNNDQEVQHPHPRPHRGPRRTHHQPEGPTQSRRTALRPPTRRHVHLTCPAVGARRASGMSWLYPCWASPGRCSPVAVRGRTHSVPRPSEPVDPGLGGTDSTPVAVRPTGRVRDATNPRLPIVARLRP